MITRRFALLLTCYISYAITAAAPGIPRWGELIEVWCPPIPQLHKEGAWVSFLVTPTGLRGGGGYLPLKILQQPEKGWQWRQKQN